MCEMAGTVRGRHSIYSSTASSPNGIQEIYVSFFKALNIIAAAGVCTRIAWYDGDSGTGDGYWDDSGNVQATNGFSVWRFPSNSGRTYDFYMMIQWSYDDPFGGSGNGAPSRINGNDGNASARILGVQFAIAFDSGGGNASPWNGTTNNDGTDAKGNPVWAAPSGGRVHVWGRSNNTGGNYSSARQNCLSLNDFNDGATNIRAHIVCDDDNVWMAYSRSADNNYNHCIWSSIIPLAGLTPKIKHVAMCADNLTWAGSDDWGSVTGSLFPQGGIYDPREDEVLIVYTNSGFGMTGTNMNPNNQYTTLKYIEHPIGVSVNEGSYRGMVGFLDPSWIRNIWNIASNSTIDPDGSTPYDRIVLGNSQSGTHPSLIWDGVTADPTAGISRDGIDFVKV